MSEPNPYQSSIDEKYAKAVEVDFDDKDHPMAMGVVRWSVVSLVNMIVPLLFGVQLCNQWGYFGIAVACLGFSGIVYFISQRPRRFVMPIFVGTIVVAASQLLPIIHIIIGVIAISCVDRLEQNWIEPSDPMVGYGIKTMAGGFVATVITGTMLLVVGTTIGYSLRFITPDRWWRPKSRKEKTRSISLEEFTDPIRKF